MAERLTPEEVTRLKDEQKPKYEINRIVVTEPEFMRQLTDMEHSKWLKTQ